MPQRIAIMIGAGPAGLTAAYELVHKTDIKPIIYEMSGDIGGIAKTVNYKGNRIDIGPHRFFSKSDRVVEWWLNILPLQGAPSRDEIKLGRTNPFLGKSRKETIGPSSSEKVEGPDPEKTDRVMLARSRISRAFFSDRFFDYPISLSFQTLLDLGLVRSSEITLSYLKARLFPIRNERSIEDFLVNRFGRGLYSAFFKDYTEKVWGVPCDRIGPEWGTQRIKGLSLTKAVLHAARSRISSGTSIAQKNVETSLVSNFMYPKLGSGQLWEEVARIITKKGGEVHLGHRVTGLKRDGKKILEVEVKDVSSGYATARKGDYFFSTMPVKELIECFGQRVPQGVQRVAQGLVYRDFMSVGVVLRELKIRNETKVETLNNIIPDNWIYIQDRSVKLGRIQISNNMSPYLVRDENTVWIGLEYFCSEGDDLWTRSDDDFARFAVDEVARIGIAERQAVIDTVVIRMPKTYPAYLGSYDNFNMIREFTDQFKNLFLIGRNGMHRYNNQDHSMLAAMTAVENIISDVETKNNIWAINVKEEYHETR